MYLLHFHNPPFAASVFLKCLLYHAGQISSLNRCAMCSFFIHFQLIWLTSFLMSPELLFWIKEWMTTAHSDRDFIIQSSDCPLPSPPPLPVAKPARTLTRMSKFIVIGVLARSLRCKEMVDVQWLSGILVNAKCLEAFRYKCAAQTRKFSVSQTSNVPAFTKPRIIASVLKFDVMP